MGIFLATAATVISSTMFSFWKSYLESPELEILHDLRDVDFADHYTPQLTISFPDRLQTTRFLRVRIYNAGTRTATRCFAQLELIERPKKGKHTLSRVEKTLKWAEVPEFPSIPPKAGFLLNVAYSSLALIMPFPGGCDGYVRAWVCTEDAFANPKFRMQDAMCLGKYRVKVTVFSDNADPKEQRFVIHVPKKWNELSMIIDHAD